MLICIVNRKTKELLMSFTSEKEVDLNWSCWNDEYDSIKFDAPLDSIKYEKDGKVFIDFEYTESVN